MARTVRAKLTPQFIQKAISATAWDFGNDVLYELCCKNPLHTQKGIIIAKVWLIGRSYAAAIDRRRITDGLVSDAFYEDCVAPKILSSDIDTWFNALSTSSPHDDETNLEMHWRVMRLFSQCSNRDQRSLASKYLHFHFRERLYIYDSRAATTISKLTDPIPHPEKRLPALREHDKQYTKFYLRCQILNTALDDLTKTHLSPRELDKVLLAWNREHPPFVQKIVHKFLGPYQGAPPCIDADPRGGGGRGRP